MPSLSACLPVLLLLSAQALADDPTVDARLVGVEPLRAIAAPMVEERDFARMVVGLDVRDLATGESVLSWRAEEPMVPASVTKVVTAAAALHGLGPGHLYRTQIYGSGDLTEGTLEGDLIVVGGADPTLTTEKVWRTLLDLKRSGLERITGDVLLDDSYLQGDPVIPGWDNAKDHADGPSYFPPIGALGLDFGSVEVIVRPGAEPGAPARVLLEVPAPGYVELSSQVTTGAERSRARLELDRVVSPDKLGLSMGGSLPVSSPTRRFRRAYGDPTAYFGAVFRMLLDEVGMTLDGTVRRGTLPEGADRLRTLTSPTLGAILMDTNKWSSNYMAETVLRSLGAEKGRGGTTEDGLVVLREYLASVGLEPDAYAIRNGSGLSRDTHLSARQITHVLAAASADPAIAPEFIASLSIGGRDGTLRDRFDELPDAVRAKTGTLSRVHALAGFLQSKDGHRYAFAYVANDVRGGLGKAKSLMDDLLSGIYGARQSDEIQSSTLP